MSKCYIHPKKPSAHYCSECGKAICNECTFQEVVSRRVIRYTRYYQDVELDYAFYCPHCFIEYALEKGYDKSSRGVFFRFKKSPSKVNLFLLWAFFIAGFGINFLFPIGYALWLISVIAMIMLKVTAMRNYDNYKRALELTGGSREEKPYRPKKARESFVLSCPNCGKKQPPGSVFCNKCGHKL